MKRILITGISGFLGSHLAKKLKDSYKIIGVKRKNSNLWRINQCSNINIIDIDDIKYINDDIDFIIHTATNYGRNDNLISEVIDSNLMLGIKILEFAAKNKIKAFINTNTLQNPLSSPYCLSKNQFQSYFKYFKNIKIIDVYIEHMYGPFDDKNKFIYYLIEQMILNKDIELSKGEQLRDFIYIDDVVSAFEVILNNINSFDTYTHCELGSGKQTSLKDFIQLTLSIFNQQSHTKSKLLFGKRKYNDFENMNIKADISILQKLGFTPKIDHFTGITKTISYQLNRGGVKSYYNSSNALHLIHHKYLNLLAA